jgi:general secretion pathway protein K
VRERGFALLIVLWALVLVGFLIIQLTAAGRTETRIAGNLVSNAAAQAAADGAVAAAVFHFLDPDGPSRWPADGAAHRLSIGKAGVIVRIGDESGRINPNLAPEALLGGLLRAVGVEAARAETLAGAIADWIAPGETRGPQGAKAAAYRAAGLDYGPPGAPLQTIDELGRVLGMTPDLMAELRPHLSLWTRNEIPAAAAADAAVQRALDSVPVDMNNVLSTVPRQQDRFTLNIRATAKEPSGAVFTRVAVVRIGAGIEKGYQVLAWEAPDDE